MIHKCPHCNHSSYQAGELENPVCTNPKCQRLKLEPVFQEGEMEMSVRMDLDPERLARLGQGPAKVIAGRKVVVGLAAHIYALTDSGTLEHMRTASIKEARGLLEFPEEANRQLAEWSPAIGTDLGSESDHSAVHIVQTKPSVDEVNKNGDDFTGSLKKGLVGKWVEPFYYNVISEFDPVLQKTASRITGMTEITRKICAQLGLKEGDHLSVLDGTYKVIKPNPVCNLGDIVKLTFNPNNPVTHSEYPGFAVAAHDCGGGTRTPFFESVGRTFQLIESAERIEEKTARKDNPFPKVIARYKVENPLGLDNIDNMGILPVGTIINVTEQRSKSEGGFTLIQIIFPDGGIWTRYSSNRELDDIATYLKQVEIPEWEGK